MSAVVCRYRTEYVGEVCCRDLYEADVDGRTAVGEDGLGVGEELAEVGAVGGRHQKRP